MREDEIEALCKLHEARLEAGRRDEEGYFFAHISSGPFLCTGISVESRVGAVQDAWALFDFHTKTLLKQEK